jgi:hypothetical protein
MYMKTNDFKWIFLFLVFGIFISCNDSQNNEENMNSNDVADVEALDNSDEATDSGIDNLEDRMDNIMNENEDFEGKSHKDVSIIKAEGAKEVEVNIKIGAGQLKISGGSSELLTGGFKYSDEAWKPIIKYKVTEGKGFLYVKQPDSDNFNINNDDKYAWNLKFSEDLPLEFNVELGAGMSDIYLDNLKISRFDMNMGVGKTEIDLGNKWMKDADIHLNGGIGLSVIHLPKSVGVILNIEKGLGSVDVNNMIKKSNSEYVNEAFNKSNITLKVYLKTGIGKIEVD